MQAVETHNFPKAEESSVRFDAELWRMSRQLKDSRGMQTMARNKASNRFAHGSDMKAAPGNLPKLKVMPDALAQPFLNSLPVMSLEFAGLAGGGSGKNRRSEKPVREGFTRGEGSGLS
jgi:hypothetical protein